VFKIIIYFFYVKFEALDMNIIFTVITLTVVIYRPQLYQYQ